MINLYNKLAQFEKIKTNEFIVIIERKEELEIAIGKAESLVKQETIQRKILVESLEKIKNEKHQEI